MSDLQILFSAIWQTTTTIISGGGSCVIVDPGYFPREIETIATLAGSKGRLEAIVFTHGHWDHIVGHGVFPGSPVCCSTKLAEVIAAGDETPLEKARRFDSRWYVARPIPLAWPTEVRGLQDGCRLRAGALDMHVLSLPGHSADSMGLLHETDGILIVGDYLSPCEIPFVNNLDAYRSTLERLIAMMDREVVTVVPGHGHELTVSEARRIARADLEYVNRLIELRTHCKPGSADAIPLPRAAGVDGMHEHHLDNVRAVLTDPRH